MKIQALRPLFLLLTISWAGIIYYLSSQPGQETTPLFPLQDKLFHAVAFGILGFLAMGVTKASINGYKIRQVWGVVILVTLYGMLDEFHQRFVPGRTADIYDVIADMAGGILGAWMMYYLLSKRPSNK